MNKSDGKGSGISFNYDNYKLFTESLLDAFNENQIKPHHL